MCSASYKTYMSPYNFKVLFYSPSIKIILCFLKCVPTSAEPQKEHLTGHHTARAWICHVPDFASPCPIQVQGSSSPEPWVSCSQGSLRINSPRNHYSTFRVGSKFHLTAQSGFPIHSTLAPKHSTVPYTHFSPTCPMGCRAVWLAIFLALLSQSQRLWAFLFQGDVSDSLPQNWHYVETPPGWVILPWIPVYSFLP